MPVILLGNDDSNNLGLPTASFSSALSAGTWTYVVITSHIQQYAFVRLTPDSG
jgi:hypothetical protein